jgi:predicted metal-dependent peptidase
MTAHYTDAQRAEGKIGIAIRRIAERYVFHCAVLEQFRLQERPAVATMAVTISGRAILLLYNAQFVLGTPMAQLVGVLLHETHHVVLGHLVANPTGYPDRWARTVAEEITANEFIEEPLPGGAVLLEDFPMLRPMQSTAERYDLLKHETVQGQITLPGGQPLGGGCGIGSALDDHTVWVEAHQDTAGSKATVETIVHDAVLEVGPSRVPGELKDALRNLGIAGHGQYDLAGSPQGHLDWRRLLRRYVGQVLQVRPTFSRPSRRFPDLVGIVPGQRRQGALPRVMAVIDTSGSVMPELLQLISAELALLARRHTVVVVECDAVVHAVFEYRAPLQTVQGRGGTDFRPPLAREFLQEHRPDLVVYFTDGFGPAPERAPTVPLIWCLVPGGERPARWGRVIQMGNQSSQ